MDELNRFEAELRTRAEGACELCRGGDGLDVFLVPPAGEASAERCVLLCQACQTQIEGSVQLDGKHWFCLKESVWSEVPAVQVVSFRLLKALESEDWAQDLLGQVYLAEEVQAWADQGAGGDEEASAPTLDSNGSPLAEGDAVTLIKDLDVKGAGFVAKRGTMVRNIHLIAGDPENIEGRVNKTTLVLKTKFLKKA